MDEQLDQAVLEMEEVETGTDYNYLSILREMQESLSDDEDAVNTFGATGGEAAFPIETAPEMVDSALPSAADTEINNSVSATFEDENEVPATDYLADAQTLPLPQLPSDFNNNLMTSSWAIGSEETDSGLSDEMVVRDDNSFSAAVSPPPIIEQSGVEKDAGAAEINDLSFDEFAELSPILFDTNEQTEIAEPDLDSELSREASAEITSQEGASGFPENSLENSSVNSSVNSLETGWSTISETFADDLPATTNETESNQMVGQMVDENSKSLDENLKAADAAFDADVETEAPTDLITAGSEGAADFALGEESFDEPVTTNFEQHFAEQDLSAESPENPNETLADDDLAGLDLPDTMFLNQDESDLTFTPAPLPPALALLDAEQEEGMTAVDAVAESGFSDPDSDDFETNNLGLSVPWFLQDELAAKHSAAEDNFPEPLFTEESLVNEALPAESKTVSDDISLASPLAAENNSDETIETIETMPVSRDAIAGQNGFNKHLSSEKADEMSATFSFESSIDDFSETHHPENLPENFLAEPLENNFNILADKVSDETPEALLLKNSETPEAPENNLTGFETPPEPQFDDDELPPLSEPLIDQALTSGAAKQDSANQKASPTKHHQLEKASFLEERFVIFRLDDILYAFPAVNVAEIGQLLPITPLPFVPSWFLGISHLRGDILSVVGLRELWQKNTAVPHKAKILIVHSEKQHLTVALVVDAVREMHHVAPEEIVSDKTFNNSHFAPYQIGMVDYEGQNLCLLNAEKLLETLRK